MLWFFWFVFYFVGWVEVWGWGFEFFGIGIDYFVYWYNFVVDLMNLYVIRGFVLDLCDGWVGEVIVFGNL